MEVRVDPQTRQTTILKFPKEIRPTKVPLSSAPESP